MEHVRAEWSKLARKLIEVFAASHDTQQVFTRYWRLAGPLEVFCQQAVSPLEQTAANALRRALEVQLKRWGPGAFHDDAAAVTVYLGGLPAGRGRQGLNNRSRKTRPRAGQRSTFRRRPG